MGQMVGTLTWLLLGLQMTDLVGQVQHDRAQCCDLLRSGVGQASGSPRQDHGLLRTGTFFLLPLALLDLPGSILLLPAHPVLVLQAGKLILVLPTLGLHLPVEVLLALGQTHPVLSGRIVHIITER